MIGRHADNASGSRDGGSRHRLFFALSPDVGVGAAIADTVERLCDQATPGGRRVGRHRYHLTLQFLGEFHEFPEALAQVALAAGSCVNTPGFSLMLDRASSFDNRGRVWWVGPASVLPELVALTQQLGDALQQRGVPRPTQRFTPHVTILRNARRALPQPVTIAPIPWPVRSFALVHSRDDVHGYKMLREWSLSEPGADRRLPAV